VGGEAPVTPVLSLDSSHLNPSTNRAITEPTYPEEGERLFHSHMWVKGTPLHFIVDSGSQKNLISVEVVK
jgi:hypothetical protein